MHNTEQTLIGALLLDNDKIDDVIDILNEQDFYNHNCRMCFRGLVSLREDKQPADIFTLAEWLEKHARMKNSLADLGMMAKNGGTPANATHYAQAIKNRSIERQLIDAAKSVIDIVTGQGETSAKLDAAQEAFTAINFVSEKKGPRSIKDILPNVVNALDERFHADGTIIGLPTGFKDLDEMTAGLQKGDLIIVAGRPSMGKTTLAMNIAENAIVDGKTVLVFSLEMSAEQLVDRGIASVGTISFGMIRTGKLEDDNWNKLTATIGRLIDTRLWIDDAAGISIHELKARARKQHRKTLLDLIVVDYLQLMTAEGDNRVLQVGAISAGLKALAKELGIPVVCLSQLNRSLEQRGNKRPVMSDLRDSGAIEQDADVIAFVYRDEIYNPDTADKGTAEIILGKQRNGPIGTVRLTFQGEYCRFKDYIKPDYVEEPEVQPMKKKYSRGFNH